MEDLFKKIYNNKGDIGKWASLAEGYFVFPKLEGAISNRMKFNGKEIITWSVNDYLGLANHPEVRKVDSEASKEYGSAYPMGARMMSGHTTLHEELESKLANFVSKDAAYLLNFGYQGILSTIDTLVSKNDIIVYDIDAHACIVDGVRLHVGKRFTYQHNDMKSLEKNLIRATKIAEQTGGGILVISEGVFGMRGEQGKLKEIVKLKTKYKFRFLVDDAHGFGTLGKTGAGAGEEQGVQDDIIAVRKVLESQGFEVEINENPKNRTEIIQIYDQFIRKNGRDPQNRLLFYFAGHGHTQLTAYGEDMGYIVPSTSPNPKRDLDGFLDTALDMQQVEVFAKRIQSKHALFIFDSCFSGAIFALSRAIPEDINYKTSKPVRQFITSGGPEENVPDESIFRRQFVAALQGEGDTDQDMYQKLLKE